MGVADGMLAYIGINEGFQGRRAGRRVNVEISGLLAGSYESLTRDSYAGTCVRQYTRIKSTVWQVLKHTREDRLM